jgi:hypothetical protein
LTGRTDTKDDKQQQYSRRNKETYCSRETRDQDGDNSDKEDRSDQIRARGVNIADAEYFCDSDVLLASPRLCEMREGATVAGIRVQFEASSCSVRGRSPRQA